MDSRSRDGDSGALLSHRGGGGAHSAAAALHAHAHPAAAHPAADPDAAMLDGWLAHGGAHAHSQSGERGNKLLHGGRRFAMSEPLDGDKRSFSTFTCVCVTMS